MDQAIAKRQYLYANVKIKQESVSWNWNQQNPQIRKQKQDELSEKYRKDFYTFINAIVESGGTICMDRNSLDNDWRIHGSTLRIKIPKDYVDQVRSLPYLEYFTIVE